MKPERFVDKEQFGMAEAHVLTEGNEDHVVAVQLVTQKLSTDANEVQFVRVACQHVDCDWWNDLL